MKANLSCIILIACADAFQTGSLLLNSHRMNPLGSKAVRTHIAYRGDKSNSQENLIWKCKKHQHQRAIPLNMSSSKHASIWSSKPVTSITSHRIASLLYIITSMVLAATPNRLNNYAIISRHKLSKLGGVFGFIIAAYTSSALYNIGNDSNSNSDSTSEDAAKIIDNSTSRKLNFGLLLFTGVGFWSLPGEASFNPSFKGAFRTFVLMQISRIIGFVAAFRGWLDSNDIRFFFRSGRGFGFKIEELQRALHQTWPSLDNERGINLRRKTEKWTIYSTLFALVRFGIINNVICLYNAMKNPAIHQLNKSLYISAIARLSLITVLLSTLKRAASQGKLSEYPYKRFGYLMFAWIFSVGVVSGFVDEKLVSWILQKTVYLLAFAWPMMFKGKTDDDPDDESNAQR